MDPDIPLRLEEAAKIAFPNGGMGAAGLRKERDRGRLEVMRIAGRDFTTLAAIREMQRKCLVHPKASDSGSGQPKANGPLHGSSETDPAQSVQATANWLEQRLKELSQPTLKANTSRPADNVVSMKSP